MKADSIHLFELLGGSKIIFQIPVFQRNYEWGTSQCKQLFEDLEIVAKTGVDHFIGTVVYSSEPGDKMVRIYRVIDGQQRLITLTLLLKALSEVDHDDSQEILDEYLMNRYVDTNRHFKLWPIPHDYEAFEFIMGGAVDDEIIHEMPSKLFDNYNLFKGLIKESKFTPAQLYQALNKFMLVYIELNDGITGEDPQAIFESLNSTGVSLSSSDLVRNFLLMRLNMDDQTELYDKYWSKIEKLFPVQVFSEFLRDYLIVKKHTYVKVRLVYDDYKRYFEENGLDSETALSDLYQYAVYYDHLLNANFDDSKLNKCLRDLISLGNKDGRPYFLFLVSLAEDGKISWDLVDKLISIWESYIVRLKVLRRSGSSTSSTAKLCDIDSLDQSNLSESLTKSFLASLMNKFPNDSLFEDGLLNLKLYRNSSAKLSKLLLISLESDRTKETVNFDDVQVEHIMPQRLNKDWRMSIPYVDKVNRQLGGTLGNLTLTKYNQEMSNKSFEDKRKYYKDSNILITRDIYNNYSVWNAQSIENRSKILAKDVLRLYPYPDMTSVSKGDITGEHDITEDLNVTSSRPVDIIIGDETYSVKTWRSMLITFLESLWDMDSTYLDQIKKDSRINNYIFNVNGYNSDSGTRLSNGMVVVTHLSASVILSLIQKMCEICGISDEVRYTVKS